MVSVQHMILNKFRTPGSHNCLQHLTDVFCINVFIVQAQVRQDRIDAREAKETQREEQKEQREKDAKKREKEEKKRDKQDVKVSGCSSCSNARQAGGIGHQILCAIGEDGAAGRGLDVSVTRTRQLIRSQGGHYLATA